MGIGVLVLLLATFPRGGDDAPFALAFCGFAGVCVAASYWVAQKGATRGPVALCTLVAAAFAYAVGFVQYWSSCRLFVRVDWLVISAAAFYAQIRIGRLRSGWRLAVLALLLLLVVVGWKRWARSLAASPTIRPRSRGRVSARSATTKRRVRASYTAAGSSLLAPCSARSCRAPKTARARRARARSARVYSASSSRLIRPARFGTVAVGASLVNLKRRRGAEQVARRARSFSRLGLLRLPVLVNGAAGLVCMLDGKPFSVMAFTVLARKIAEIDIFSSPERLQQLDLTVLDR